MVERSGLRVSFPVEVRTAPADDITLSTASGRDSAYIAVHMFRGTPYQAYFTAAERIFTAHEGRPHWGKVHTRTRSTSPGCIRASRSSRPSGTASTRNGCSRTTTCGGFWAPDAREADSSVSARLREVRHVHDRRTRPRRADTPSLPEVGRRAHPPTWSKWSTVASPGPGLPPGARGSAGPPGGGLVAQGDAFGHLALRTGNRAITAVQGPCPTRRATRQGCGRLHPGRPHSTSGSSDARDVGRHHPGGPHARTACRGRLE